jgi:hypothetical protein
MTRSLGGAPEQWAEASTSFAAAVARLPSLDGFREFPAWSIEGCRLAQPLDVFAAPSMATPRAIPAGALVTAQAVIAAGGAKIAVAAPVLVGGQAFPSSLLVAPIFA